MGVVCYRVKHQPNNPNFKRPEKIIFYHFKNNTQHLIPCFLYGQLMLSIWTHLEKFVWERFVVCYYNNVLATGNMVKHPISFTNYETQRHEKKTNGTQMKQANCLILHHKFIVITMFYKKTLLKTFIEEEENAGS